MPKRQAIGLVVLVLVAGVFGRIVYQRGFGLRLGAAPAALETPYSTEEAWIVDEIVRDITEMSAFPATPPSPATVKAAPGGRYHVAIPGGSTVDVDLGRQLWSPDAFAALARSALGGTDVAAASSSRSVHESLLGLTPATLVEAAADASRSLGANMRNAAAHQAAALVIGGFGLRESSWRAYDTRWAMNRMTAHLAMAAALAPSSAATTDGRLARAVLLTLANHQQRALEMADGLAADHPSPAVAAWTRALRVRITQDWRRVPDPARATLLEKLEYFRARRATVTGTRGEVEVRALGASVSAPWLRIMESNSMGVEDGWLVDGAFDMERAEYEEVYQRIHGQTMPADPFAALNARATRAVRGGAIDVLPWGAWAEFATRHLELAISRTDAFFRHALGSDGRADTRKAEMKRDWGSLTMFPIATLWWTKGPRGADADLRYIKDMVDVTVAQPERLTPMEWAFLHFGTKYEPVRRSVPPPQSWFIRPSPRVPFEAAMRLKDLGSDGDLAAILREAPYDMGVIVRVLGRFGPNPPYEEVLKAYGPRLDYDLAALRTARAQVKDDEGRLRLLRRSCELSAAECMALGWELAGKDRAFEAADAYERAFADPSVDVVALANYSGWLVTYYYQHGRVGPALQLAERSAATGAFWGHNTKGYLLERLKRFEEAEAEYERGASHYDQPWQLLGFYYRAVNVHKQTRFDERWQTARERVFPQGLSNAPFDDSRPAQGVIVVKEDEDARKVGLQAGDIIIGLEGWHVDTLEQFRSINAFYENDVVKVTAWRGKAITMEIPARQRALGGELRTYPIEGWGER